jgi:hypothetical protein
MGRWIWRFRITGANDSRFKFSIAKNDKSDFLIYCIFII